MKLIFRNQRKDWMKALNKLGVVLAIVISYTANAQDMSVKRPIVIAHRGASGYAPENTIVAFDKAIELGADMVELDVHFTKDEVVVVLHDETLDRTTDKEGLVKDYNWDEIKDADAGSWKGEEFKGEKLPTLDEVIKHLNGRTKLLIEIKDGGNFYPGLEKKVWEIVQANNAQSWCEVQSFSQDAVEIFHSLNTELPLYKLVVGNIPVLPVHVDIKLKGGGVLKYKEYAGVNPNKKFVRKRIVKKLHKRGQKMFVWTVNKEEDMRKIIDKGVDGIITNYPDRLLKVLEEMGK